MGNKRTCLEAESSMDGCGSLRQFERVEEWLEDLALERYWVTLRPAEGFEEAAV